MTSPDPTDTKTRDIKEALAEAEVWLEEMEEAGDLEDRLEALLVAEDARRDLQDHLNKLRRGTQ